jgi:Amt family ammonium transporter
MGDIQTHLNFIWILMATVLVFIMQAGFTCLEAGMTRAKNSINVAMKNLVDIMVATLLFSLIGFPIMFGESLFGVLGTNAFFFDGLGDDPWDWAILLFQIVFAGTAATIVSGAIAERVKFSGYIIGTIIIVLIIYPLFGHWAWGSLWLNDQEGWLESLGFMDFAGSTVVHSIGAWVALAAAIVVGPRIGKYSKDGQSTSFSGSNSVLATLGVFLLWLGWFGFNAGSTLLANADVALIALNTQLGAVSGGCTALFIAYFIYRRAHVESTLNGILGGLVSITASANVISPSSAIFIGAIGGFIVVISHYLIDHTFKVDDAIGAIAVHGVAGVWGTMAVALFANPELLTLGSRISQLSIQLLGAGIAFIWAFGIGYLLFWSVNKLYPLRVSTEDETAGLNVSEHGERIAMIDSILAMEEIAASKGDLTKTLPVHPSEENAELHQSFNRLLSKLNTLVEEVKGESHFVSETSEQLINLTNELEAHSIKQQEFINKSAIYIDNTKEQLENEAVLDEQVIATIQESFGTMEILGNKFEDIHNDIKNMTESIVDVTSSTKHTNHSVQTMQEQMNQITQFSTKINTIIQSITSIAEKINLLSLNARIEAARAGEHGLGFSVVAEEIRKLADQSQMAATEISSILNENAGIVKSGKEELIHFMDHFQRLVKQLDPLPTHFDKINGEIHTINQETSSFVFKLDRISKDTSQIGENRIRQQEEIKYVVQMMKDIGTIANQTTALSTIIQKDSVNMKQQSVRLMESVSQFKTRLS